MKPLLDFLFRWAIALTIGNIVMLSLMLLALIMWDIEYFLLADKIKDRILYKDQNE